MLVAVKCERVRSVEQQEVFMATSTLLLILLVVLLIALLPSWPYSRSWGYYPSGGLGLVLLVLVILLLMGYF
jgi:hypothetical protein